jgi:hypothetical protein
MLKSLVCFMAAKVYKLSIPKVKNLHRQQYLTGI